MLLLAGDFNSSKADLISSFESEIHAFYTAAHVSQCRKKKKIGLKNKF